MTGQKRTVPGAPASPAMVASEYSRLAKRLLERLTESGVHAERRGDEIVLVRQGSGVSVPVNMPTGVLAELLQSGAVECRTRLGRAMFRITEAGRARARRDKAGSTGFADQHRALETREVEFDGARHVVEVNTREDPLEVFRKGRHLRHLVGAAELEAGDRFVHDLARAQAVPQVTANWSRLVVDGAGYNPGLSVPERVLEARRLVDAALRAVGPDFSGILIDALGFAKGLELLEREHALPTRSGKVVLGLALRQLARHYGLANVARGRNAGEMRHWGAEGYRPSLKAG